MRAAAVLTAALAAGLAGCVNLAPDYARPQAPVPAAFNQASAGAAKIDVGWHEFFSDQRLREVIELTLANNRDLRIAAANIEQARAQYRVQRADRLPAIDATGDATRQRTASTGTTSEYSVELGLASYELDFFGRVKSLSDAALQSYLATEETRRSTQISLVAETATAWLTLLADEQRLDLAERTLKSRQASYDLTNKSFELGGQSGLTLAQIQTTVDGARVDVAAYRSQVELDRHALDLLVGSPVPAELLPGGEAAAPAALLVDVPAGLPSSLLQQRPDVLAAEHGLQASHANIGAARAAFFPSVTLTAQAGTASTALSGLFKRGSGAWLFEPNISLPIFDAGANRANLQLAEADRDVALATYEKAVQTAFHEVADALSQHSHLGDQLAAQQSLTQTSQKSFQLTKARFDSGADSYLDVLVTQISLYTAQQTMITLELAQQTNRIVLYKVLGGGWERG
jgi:outer membrane protein, multidrug efflux system